MNFKKNLMLRVTYVTSKFTHPFSMPSSRDEIRLSLKSSRMSFDSP